MIWDEDNWDFDVALITSDVLTVMTVNYSPDMVEIEAARALPVVAKRVEDIQRNVDAITEAELPVAPEDA